MAGFKNLLKLGDTLAFTIFLFQMKRADLVNRYSDEDYLWSGFRCILNLKDFLHEGNEKIELFAGKFAGRKFYLGKCAEITKSIGVISEDG